MKWYTEVIIKEAARSEDRLLSVLQQTWPQVLKINEQYRNEFLPSLEKKPKFLQRRAVFKSKVIYNWEGKDDYINVEIDHDPNAYHPAGAAYWSKTIIYHAKNSSWNNNLNLENSPDVWIHELAHILQGQSERGRNLNRDSKKGTVAYAHRAYEIHARWTEALVGLLYVIEKSVQETKERYAAELEKVKEWETKKQYATEREKEEFDRFKLQLERWMTWRFLNGSNLFCNQTEAQEKKIIDLMLDGNVSQGAYLAADSVQYCSQKYVLSRVDPRQWAERGMEAYREQQGKSSKGWVAPSDVWTQNYLNKLNKKFKVAVAQKIFDSYTKLMNEYKNMNNKPAINIDAVINKRQENKNKLDEIAKQKRERNPIRRLWNIMSGKKK